MREARILYEQKISQREKIEDVIHQWLQKIKQSYSSELKVLAAKNAELITNNEILVQQVSALAKIKDKLKDLQDDDDELDLDNVFISSNSLEMIKDDLLQTRNLIWDGIKDRILAVISKPWEAVAKKEHKDHILLLQERLDNYEKENNTLQEQIKELQTQKTRKPLFQMEGGHLSPGMRNISQT